MFRYSTTSSAVAALAVLVAAAPVAWAQNAATAFTYQGQLRFNNVTVVGPVDFEFKMYDSLTGGKQIGPTLTANRVPLQGGRFAVQLDFEVSPFGAEPRWLEISLRSAGADAAEFTTLATRQLLSSSPYSIQGSAAVPIGGGPKDALPSGTVGPKGDRGEPGPKGEKGDKGSPGERGEKGEQGPRGLQGIAGPPGPVGPAGVSGTSGNGGSSNVPLVSSYVVGPKDSGAGYTSIQAAIDKAVADGASAAAPVVVLVRPGSFKENVRLASGVHIQGVVSGRSFAATVLGTVTAALGDGGAVSWNSVNVNSPVGAALIISGDAAQQLFVSQSTMYSSKGAVVNVSGGGSITARGVTFQVINGGTEPVIQCSGGSVLVEGGLLSASGLDRIAVIESGSARVILRDTDVRGSISVNDDASFTLRGSEIQAGEGPTIAAKQSKVGLVVLLDSTLVTTMSPTIQDPGEGPVLFAHLIYSGGGVGMPETAFRLPGSDEASGKPDR